MNHVLDLPQKADLFAKLRAMVEAGEPDGPVTVTRDGKPSVKVRSLYSGALLSVVEEPRCRLAPWSPHPMATVGPRMQSLLDARAWWNAERRLLRRTGR